MAKKKKKKTSWQTQILLIFALLASVAAMPTSILLFLGMLPTAVAAFIDRTREKTRALTVGATNIAGCAPFVLQLWKTENSIANSFSIITDPRTIIVMYCAAGMGYMIDWAVSGLVGSVMAQRGAARREQIARKQADLIERWGREVTGDVPVDMYGFPIDSTAPAPDSAPRPAGKGKKT